MSDYTTWREELWVASGICCCHSRMADPSSAVAISNLLASRSLQKKPMKVIVGTLCSQISCDRGAGTAPLSLTFEGMLTAVIIKKKGNNMVAFSSEVPLHIVSFLAKSEPMQSLPLGIAHSHQARTEIHSHVVQLRKTHLQLIHVHDVASCSMFEWRCIKRLLYLLMQCIYLYILHMFICIVYT